MFSAYAAAGREGWAVLRINWRQACTIFNQRRCRPDGAAGRRQAGALARKSLPDRSGPPQFVL